MFQAQNGRQLNLAAQTIKAFFAEQTIDVPHSMALRLVGRLLGFPSYEAAQASLDGKGKGRATNAATWRDLAHAIGTLDESQLDLPVYLADSPADGSSLQFSKALGLLLANDKVFAPRGADFEAFQPMLHVEKYVPGQETDDVYRVAMQLEAAADQPGSMAEWHIERKGLEGAIAHLNHTYDISISLGEYIVYSESEHGFWNADFGFVSDKASATGVSALPVISTLPSDVELVRYVDAVDAEEADDDCPFEGKIQGTRVSRYSWPARFEAIWSEVRPDALKTCNAAAELLLAKGFQAKVSERPHGAKTGYELVMSLSKDGVRGGEMVLALANFHASSAVLPCAAGMNWFFKPPARDTMFGSILSHEDNRKPFATEAGHFKRLVSLVSASELADFMAKMYEPEQVSQ